VASERKRSQEGSAAVTTTSVHLVLQGKGGVGKSLVASILAQYFRRRNGRPVHCVDTDPVNRTLAQYQALGAEPLDLLHDGVVDQRAFDGLMERLLTEDGTFVVDSGAATFIPLWSYILENQVASVLRDAGRVLTVHCVVTGGQALLDTLNGFAQLAETASERSIVLWVNEYFGRVEHDGRVLSELPVYEDNAARLLGSVAIPKRNRDTFGRDLEDLLRQKLTFREGLDSTAFPLMARQRLRVMERELFEQLDRLDLE
jgi:hypothetical protein